MKKQTWPSHDVDCPSMSEIERRGGEEEREDERDSTTCGNWVELHWTASSLSAPNDIFH